MDRREPPGVADRGRHRAERTYLRATTTDLAAGKGCQGTSSFGVVLDAEDLVPASRQDIVIAQPLPSAAIRWGFDREGEEATG